MMTAPPPHDLSPVGFWRRRMGILETVSAVGGVLGEWVTHCRWRRRLCGVTRKFEWKWLTVIAVITVTALGCETLIESPLNHNQIITSLLLGPFTKKSTIRLDETAECGIRLLLGGGVG